MIRYAQGNMFQHAHECYVNTINCVGAMGAGIALETKVQFPALFEQYQQLCRDGELTPGDCWAYEVRPSQWVANLAVKKHYRNRIRLSWARMALRNFLNRLRNGSIPAKDVALPRIGSKNGGRGARFYMWGDNWPDDSEKGYVELFEPFLLAELEKLPNVDFTIYKL